MAAKKATPEEKVVNDSLDDFARIRDALRVPFPDDLADLDPPELPEVRRWNGPCLGYQAIIVE